MIGRPWLDGCEVFDAILGKKNTGTIVLIAKEYDQLITRNALLYEELCVLKENWWERPRKSSVFPVVIFAILFLLWTISSTMNDSMLFRTQRFSPRIYDHKILLKFNQNELIEQVITTSWKHFIQRKKDWYFTASSAHTWNACNENLFDKS